MCNVNFEATSFKLSSFKLIKIHIFVELQLAHECHIFVILFVKALSCENFVRPMFKLHKFATHIKHDCGCWWVYVHNG